MYQKSYYILFNAVTDALRQLAAGRTDDAVSLLICAQQKAEDVFLEEEPVE